jgi:pimeloyl-ACP methyl ester carboxylesterase
MKKIFFILLVISQSLSAQQKCTDTNLPIVFVHGFMGSGDNWATQIQRFSANGFCEDKLFVFDWNTVGGSSNTTALLDKFIDDVLQKTNSQKVNLVGHSAGGGLCYNYLKDSLQALKVAKYVHIGSSKMKTAAGKNAQIPTMNIYSIDDMVMKTGGDIAGAINVKQTGNDHMQVATSVPTFMAMYNFFTGSKKNVITSLSSKEFYKIIGGKGVVLAENTALAFDSFKVNIINPKTGERYPTKNSQPNGDYVNWTVFGKDGSFAFNITKENYTEFEVRPKNGRKLFYYFEPLVSNNKAVYLRALPTTGMAAKMLGNIPNDDKQTALAIFTANNAVIAGRDTLAIDSIPLSLPQLMPASKTSIATFLFDDGDELTSGKALKSLSAAPFITGVDVFIKADENKTMRIYYNGRNIVLPKRKSKDGIMIVVFN